ncbi:MAG TPA: CdaR family protein [Thermoanaerobaculia bacterium]
MSERTRSWGNWGLRLLALGIAVGIWFNASVEDRLVSSEKVVEADVIYNKPRDFIILNQLRSVNVRLLGSRRAIRQLNPYQVDVQVELNRQQEGVVTINLDSNDVLAPEGLEVVSIEPSSIQVTLEREITERVPVVPNLAGKPAGEAKAGEPEVFPNQVLVTGPRSRVSLLESLTTGPINLDGHSATFEVQVPVSSTDPLIQVAQPSQVTVRIPIQPPGEAEDSNEPPRKDDP